MPSARQFFINLRVDIFGSGLKKHKKPVYESRTYRYSSNSTRNFDHGKQRCSAPSRPSASSTSPPTRRQVAKYSIDDEQQFSSMPGAWPDDESSPSPRISPAPSYRQAQRDPVPAYNKIRYPVEKPTQIARGRNTVYIKPMTISNEPMGTRRHLRSGSDVLVVHHPTPQDLDD